MGYRKWLGFDKVMKLERKNSRKKNFSLINTQEEQPNYLEEGSFRIIDCSFSIQKPEDRLSEALDEILKFEKTFNINLDD